jgi:hypothetical protein
MTLHWVLILCGGERAVPVGVAAQAVLLRMPGLAGYIP